MEEESRETRSAGGPTGRVVGREAEAPDVAPEAFLRAFDGVARGFWEREGRWAAWAGQVARLELPRGEGRDLARKVVRWRRALGPEAGGRCYGGCAFDVRAPDAGADPPSAGWSRWPGVLFVLPAVELRRAAGRTRLVVRARGPEGAPEEAARSAADRAADRVRRRLEGIDGSAPGIDEPGSGDPGGAAPAAVEAGAPPVRRRPDREAWRDLVRAGLDAIAAGGVEKVVPARLLELETRRPPSPVRLLRRLRDDNPGTFPFLVEADPGTALVGAAPEIVASRRGDCFMATAVAGTVPEGEDEEETRRLARRLRESAKDRAEHELTVRDMREALVSVAGVARVGREPDVLRLRGMQHLITRLTAKMPDRPHVLELLEALHPTAAVNGYPREPAGEFLRRREPFDRGWFAGPVGWFDQSGDGTFAPALRCALVEARSVRLFAGAGVVEGSRPDDEWRETAMKLRPVLRALGREDALREGRTAGLGAADGGGAAGPDGGRVGD